MHWRRSQHYTAEQNLGWGPSGPYTLVGAPMVHPNQNVTLGMTAGVPGVRYEAVAASHPANDWMAVMPMAPPMPYRSTYQRRLSSIGCSFITGLPAPVRSAITSAAAGAADPAVA